MEEFLKATANFGFPIVVAGYLLLRMERTINNLTNEIRDLKEIMNITCQKLK
jgi:hypothetical protein